MIRKAIWMVALIGRTFIGYPQGTQPSLDNLVHTNNYQPGVWGALGEVKKSGSGSQDVILLPGWGFDGTIFKDFITRHEKDYRMFTVTFPGFGDTKAPPMPKEPESYAALFWTKGILNGVVKLIGTENLKKPIVISCFTYSSLIAMRLALDYPDRIGKVIIISGMAKFLLSYPSFEPRSLEQRVQYVDQILSKNWFKTVSKETWDKGNFAPGTFSKDSVAADRHWKMMSSVPIPVMVRYLCEFYCTDMTLEYNHLTVPTLVVIPAFTNEFLYKPQHAYISSFFHDSWIGALPASPKIQMITLSDTHAFVMDDQPEKLDKVIHEFVTDQWKPYPPVR